MDAHQDRCAERAEVTTHQLIYTSCRRGINGVNDGQQVFSYDADFPTQQLAAMAPTMTYRGPDLPTGVPLTEALVPTYPKAFTYALLGHQADLALNTYLGKDYMGPTGRFGNFLSHHVLVEEPPGHPAEFIGSPTFRSSMDFDEVNNPDPPPTYRPPNWCEAAWSHERASGCSWARTAAGGSSPGWWRACSLARPLRSG